jgi:hypothetical protein
LCLCIYQKDKKFWGCVYAQARPGNWTMKMICESLVDSSAKKRELPDQNG